VTPGGTLVLDVGNGNITVHGGSDQAKLQVQVEGASEQFEEVLAAAEVNGGGVRIQTSGWSRWFGTGGNGDIVVSVPMHYNLDLTTKGGKIVVENVQGRVEGTTSGGSSNVRSVTGPIRMRTSGGGISISDIGADADVKTSGGAIAATRIKGSLRASTSGGGIQVSNVNGDVIAATSSGTVTAQQVSCSVVVRTSGGGIRAEAAGRIVADTSGGPIDITLTGTNQGIIATTSGGGITITVPNNVAADLDASTSGGSVKCELPMTSARRDDHKLEGSLNGGGKVIKARTTGGSIRIVGG
jgi:DUF4097 and DUF4098 domain-containing protein YvlB